MIGCDDINSLHQKYLDKGEEYYIGMIDSVKIFPGKERAQFEWQINADPRITGAFISWNGNEGSTIIPLVREHSGIQTVNAEITIPEGIYTFTFANVDADGNKSKSVELPAVLIYGLKYARNLQNRPVYSSAFQKNVLTINWSLLHNAQALYTTVRYLDYSDAEHPSLDSIEVANTVSQTQIPNVRPGDVFSVKTAYLPEKGIDTIYAPPIEYTVTGVNPHTNLLDKINLGWTIAAYSDQEDDRPARTIIDGDYSNDSYWHSAWSNGNAPLPHWVIIDMKHKTEVARIVTQRYSNTDASTIQYFIGNTPDPDAGTWLQIADGVFSETSPGGILDLNVYSLDEAVGRYLKLVLPNSNRDPYTALCEVDVYGIEGVNPYDNLLDKINLNWTIAAYSDQEDGDGRENFCWKIIDGDYSNDSYWHSAWSSYTGTLPHWAIIDMKQQIAVARIVTQRYNNTDASTIQYFIGNTPDPDADTWLQIADGVFSETSPGGILDLSVYSFDESVGRYLKLVLPDSNREPYTAITEVDVYGE
jgi:hypothetical protein